ADRRRDEGELEVEPDRRRKTKDGRCDRGRRGYDRKAGRNEPLSELPEQDDRGDRDDAPDPISSLFHGRRSSTAVSKSFVTRDTHPRKSGQARVSTVRGRGKGTTSAAASRR